MQICCSQRNRNLPLKPVQKSGHCFEVSIQLWLPNAHAPVWTSVPQAQSASSRHDVVQALLPPPPRRGAPGSEVCPAGAGVASLSWRAGESCPAGGSELARAAEALAGSAPGIAIGPDGDAAGAMAMLAPLR